MIAVEEKDLQSVKTDASLYNGQPTDTGTQCHNVGVTSSTPSILKNKDGVSVESVHTHSKQVCIEGIIRKAKEIICQMVVGKVVEPLWNNEWLRPELVTNIPYV